MKVLPVSPFGYCLGVERALEIALRARKENPDRNVYLLGMLIHNEASLSRLEEEGMKILSEKQAPLSVSLSERKEGEVVLFSAHGHPASFDETAKEKGLLAYDATCPFVKSNVELGRSLRPLIYLGAKGHLECEAFLANCPDAYFYDVPSGKGDWRDCPGAPSVLAQTTLGKNEIERAMQDIASLRPKAVLVKGRCLATVERQDALEKSSKEADATIVLGSPSSNNSRKLYEIASSNGPAYLCLGLAEVKKLDLKGFRVIALSSGASTCKETFLEVQSYLESL